MHAIVLRWLVVAAALVATAASLEGASDRYRSRVRAQDRLNLRRSNSKDESDVQQNVCSIGDSMSLTSIMCMCDSLVLQDATSAKCFVFNVTSQNDFMWSSFRTQSHLQELKINLRPDGRLNYVPELALQRLPNLTHLEVTQADINTLVARTFSSSIKLRVLSLQMNQVRLTALCSSPH